MWSDIRFKYGQPCPVHSDSGSTAEERNNIRASWQYSSHKVASSIIQLTNKPRISRINDIPKQKNELCNAGIGIALRIR